MVQHALLFAITSLLAIAMVTIGGPILLEHLNEKMSTSGSGISLLEERGAPSEPSSIDLNLGSAAVGSNFMREFCTSLDSMKQGVKISC